MRFLRLSILFLASLFSMKIHGQNVQRQGGTNVSQRPAPPSQRPSGGTASQRPATPSQQPSGGTASQRPATPSQQPSGGSAAQRPATPSQQPSGGTASQRPATPSQQPSGGSVSQRPATPSQRPSNGGSNRPYNPPPASATKPSTPNHGNNNTVIINNPNGGNNNTVIVTRPPSYSSGYYPLPAMVTSASYVATYADQDRYYRDLIAEKVGVYAYPMQYQTDDALYYDEMRSYDWAVKNSGYDPESPYETDVERPPLLRRAEDQDGIGLRARREAKNEQQERYEAAVLETEEKNRQGLDAFKQSYIYCMQYLGYQLNY